MAVTFEFRRHSIKDGPTSAMIGPKGYALAREVGKLQLRSKRFTSFFASDVWRTHQTLAAFAEGAGDFILKLTPPSPPIYVQREDVWALWRSCREAEKRGEDMVQAALYHDAELFERLAEETAGLFTAWKAGFGDDDHVLVVGHSPHLEIMSTFFTGVVTPGLKECEGFRLVVGEAVVMERGTPDLDPSAIRTALFP